MKSKSAQIDARAGMAHNSAQTRFISTAGTMPAIFFGVTHV